MKIEDATQTVDGHPVRIYATDGGGWFPIHGAVWFKRFEEWKLMDWTRNGGAQSKDYGFDLNLHDWKDQIPWDCLQDWIQWVAKDKDGDWWVGYRKKPIQYTKMCACMWYTDDVYCVLCGVRMPEGPARWTDAIAQRPDVEN